MRRHLPRADRPFRFPRSRVDSKTEKKPDVAVTKRPDTPPDSKALVPPAQSHKAEPETTPRTPTKTPPQETLESELPKKPAPKADQERDISDTASMATEPMGLGELANTFVPWQTYGKTLGLREALQTGTLFPELVRTPPLYKRPGR